METLTMQQVADLAGVQRPVVSMWRSRSAGSAEPFPQSVAAGQLLFDASEVGRWLVATGRGNNSEAQADAALFSTLMDTAAAQLDEASALLLLHALSGSPLTDQDPDDLVMLCAGHGVETLLTLTDADTALRNRDLIVAVDALAEAGVSATRVLSRLIVRAEGRDGPLAAESLTAKGDALATEVVSALAADADRALVPWGPGGLRLVAKVVDSAREGERPRVAMSPELPPSPVDRLLWRFIAASGARLVPARDAAATLRVGQWATVDTAGVEGFFDEIDDVMLSLEPGHAALLLAPAPILVDERPAADRRVQILGGAPSAGGGYTAPLRYVARLPGGLCRFGGRRRMGLWVLGAAAHGEAAHDAPPHTHDSAPHTADRDRAFTTYGEHSAHELSAEENRAVASDAVAALRGGTSRRGHAFLRSEHRLTSVFVARVALHLPVTTEVAEDGGDALARVWEKRAAAPEGLLEGFGVEAAGRAEDHSIPWDEATKGRHRPARMIKGARIPEAVFAAGPGGIGVIGPDEVRGIAPVGGRSVDLVELLRWAPAVELTAPGDVIFTTTTPCPAAIIDAVGGQAVQAPARILRCLEPIEGKRRIVPELAVRDINAARGSDFRSWRLRSVVVVDCEPWRAVAARAAEHRARLLAQVQALDALTSELSDGLAAGTLRFADGGADF